MNITLGMYRTRDGRLATIERLVGTYCTGKVATLNGVCSWFMDGQYAFGLMVGEHPLDLVERIEHSIRIGKNTDGLHRPHCSCGWAGGFHRQELDAYAQFNEHHLQQHLVKAGQPSTTNMTASEVNAQQQQSLLNQKINQLVREHHLMDEQLTENQLVEAMRQALACGDFQRLVSPHGQAVVYLPFSREQHLQARIEELENERNTYKDQFLKAIDSWSFLRDGGYCDFLGIRLGESLTQQGPRFRKLLDELMKRKGQA